MDFHCIKQSTSSTYFVFPLRNKPMQAQKVLREYFNFAVNYCFIFSSPKSIKSIMCLLVLSFIIHSTCTIITMSWLPQPILCGLNHHGNQISVSRKPHMTHTYRSPFFFLSGDVASSRRSCVTWPHTLCSIGSRSGLIAPVSELNMADMAPGVWFRSCPRPDGRFGPDSAPAELEAPPPLDRQLKARPPMSRGMNPLSMSDLFWTQHTQRLIVHV